MLWELNFLEQSASSSDSCVYLWLRDSWEDALCKFTNWLVGTKGRKLICTVGGVSVDVTGPWHHFFCNRFSSSSFKLIKISLLARKSSFSLGSRWCFLHLWRATLDIPYVSSNGFSVLIHTFLFCFSVEEWNSSKADLVKTELVLMAGEKCNLIFCLQCSNQELK